MQTKDKKKSLGKKDTSLPSTNNSRLFIASCVMLIMALVMLIVSFVVQRQDQYVRPANKGVSVGAPVRQGLVDVTLEKVSLAGDVGSFVAGAGNSFMVIDLVITNTSDAVINISPSMDMYVKSNDGDIAYMAPYDLSNPLRSGKLLPGESVRGQLSYVTVNNLSYSFYIESGWSGGVVKFELESYKHNQEVSQ